MSNNLQKLAKDLRAFAKRCKDIKYTRALLFVFLLTGLLSMAAPADNVETARKDLNTSITDMKKLFKEAKQENNKLMKGSNLELIQLMEQGDHVVKTPWSSWQYGMNYFYSDWRGTYKGRGDKTPNQKYERFSSSKFAAYSGGKYGTTDLNSKVIEPISAVPVDAAVKPKDIQKTALNINLPKIGAPVAPVVNVNAKSVSGVSAVSVTPPRITLDLPKPNTTPFTGYSFQNGTQIATVSKNSGANGETWYNGYNGGHTTGYGHTTGSRNNYVAGSGQRPANMIYINNQYDSRPTAAEIDAGNVHGFLVKDLVLYGSGNVDGSGRAGNGSGLLDGLIMLHTVWNGTIENTQAYLYGRTNFLSIETWHAGIVNFKGTQNLVSIDGNSDENMLFYIYPSQYEYIGRYNFNQEGGIIGNLNADIKSNKNIVYGVIGLSRSFDINSNGNYQAEGSGNIIYAGMGYSPDYSNLKGEGTGNAYLASPISDIVGTGLTPSIKFTKAPELYGDENIALYFSKMIDNRDIKVYDGVQGSTDNHWNKTTLGIYQGEISASARIGKKLAISPTATQQTAKGNMAGGSDQYTEKSVGILAQSGQRGKTATITRTITPSEDLGAENIGGKDFTFFDKDKVHNLKVANIDVTFGKYSRNGVMIASQNGTVIDVSNTNTIPRAATPTNPNNNKITNGSVVKDYENAGIIVSDIDKIGTLGINEAATGTIVALSQGKWGTDVETNSATNTQMSSNTKTSLGDLPSEINIGAKVELSARYQKENNKEYYPIAYVADGGRILSEKTTTAYGYKSVLGYASNGGNITMGGDVTAKDEWAKVSSGNSEYLYSNIAGYSKGSGSGIKDPTSGVIPNITPSVVTINGNATINGLGAIADGSGAEVHLKGTNNNINTSSSGALAALNRGYVSFNGGKIVNEDFTTSSLINPITGATETKVLKRNNTTPFYATGGGIIDFTNAGTTPNTTIEMATGILKEGADGDYTANNATAPTLVGTTYTQATGTKYNGMKNVKVKLTGDDVVFNIVDGATTNWTNTSSYLTDVIGASGMKLGAFDFNGKSYKSYYTNGIFNMTGTNTINLDNSSTSGLVVSGTAGNLTVGGTGSNEIEFNNITMEREIVNIGQNVTLNSTTGKGLAMPSNNTATSNADSGYFNEGTINITGGASAVNTAVGLNVSYGTIENKSTGMISVDEGVGIYGTNGSKLKNEGTINITTKGYGIVGKGTDPNIKQNYGTDTLTSLTLGNKKTVEIINNGTINLTGDGSIAIYAENNTRAPRTNVTVNNTSALTVGDEGIGIAVMASTPVAPTLPTGASAVTHDSTNQGGTIRVTATGTGSDIITGVNGKGIYAQNSDINLIGGDYVIETPEKGIGIFASGSTNVNGTLEYKYNGSTTGTGMGIVYDSAVTNNANVKLTNATNTTGGMIGVYATATSGTFTNNGNITGSSSALEFGIVSDGVNVVNAGNITLGNATTQKKANVGIYAKANNTITNNGRVTVGDNAIGVYGYNVNNTSGIKAGDNGVAIYTQGTGTTVNLNSGSALTIGNNQAVGVYAVGSNQQINTNTGSGMTIGNNSFGIVNVGSGNTVTSNTANSVSLRRDAVYIYQNDNTGTVNSSTPLISTGDRNYGLYGNGTMNNAGVIDFSTGNGNVGMYATTGGIGTNSGTIKVGASNTAAKEFGVGMATGYYNETTDTVSNQGTVINRGTIEVSKPNTMGMYAVGAGSKAINYGHINLSGNETVGMYIDRGAVGENWGTIQTTAGGLKSVKGVYVANGGYIKNYGIINIAASDLKSAGIWTDKAEHAEDKANGVNPVTGVNQTGTLTPAMKVATASDMKDMGGRTIKVPPRVTAPIVTDVNGSKIPIFKVDTDNAIPAPAMVTVTSPSRITSINLPTSDFMNFPSASEATSLGMYVDTSGVNYTNPIQGINNLTGLTDINLFFGTEASRYTTAKAIEVGDNILKPYNDALSGVVTAGTTLNVTSASLTWMAQPTKNAATGLLDKVYLVKVPYTMFAKKGDTQTLNFLTGLEQKYGAEGLGTKEKSVLDKISNLNGGEGHILAQAFDEMKGHQYSSIQQRTKVTGDILSKEFNYLQKEWRNPSKDNNKIKVFGHGGEYNTDTAGVVDYRNNAYGVAYVHENETVKLGHKSGWYAGAVTNRFDFKDLGKSRETQTMVKAGLFKTISPSNDHNGSLTWTIAGEAFASINNMKRRYWIVDETFEAKSDYSTYGVALKNEIGKDFRTSARTSIRPYGALSMEYGRYSNIKEKGPMALELQGNDYFSVQPELGVSFNYTQPVGVKSQFTASLTAAYTNELGKVNDVRNKARLKGTTADYYELRGDKEDRKGNGKVDLNIGFDNTRFGVTFNAGYDTKGSNVRGGLGFRVIY